MALHFKQMTIIGVGLIGGSLGMIVRRERLAETVVGVGRRVENLETAVEVGAIDRYVSDPREGVRDADLVILAAPVDTYEQHLTQWGSLLQPRTIVTDVGSVKGNLVIQAENRLPAQVRFVGAHPIAGKETAGVQHADAALYQGRQVILTPLEQTRPEMVQKATDVWSALGSQVLKMAPHHHDEAFAAVSHLPHVAAFALVNALAEVRDRMAPDLDLRLHSGGGLRDTTRIAASSPEMWRDICLWNRDNLVQLIEVYERHLRHLKELIRSGDGPGLEKEMEMAKIVREQLNGQPA